MKTELMAAAADEIAQFGGMPLPLLLAIVTVAGPVVTVLVTQAVKKFRTAEDTREDKVVVLDASDKLIQRFQQIVAESDEKHAKEIEKLSKDVQELREELDLLKQERLGLLWAVRQLVRIARKYGGDAAQSEIDDLELEPAVLA